MQTSGDKPRRLGKGLSALIGGPTSGAAAGGGGARVGAGPRTTPASGQGAAPADGSGARGNQPIDRVASGPANAFGSSADNGAGGGRGGGVPDGQIVELKLDQITPSPFQPRRTFDEAQLNELAASIRGSGLVQPIIVRRPAPGAGGRGVAGADAYELVAGERRWRAAKLAGLSVMPALVRVLSDEQAAEWALIENLQRSDLKAMERAEAMRGLCERFGLSHAQLAEKLGVDRSSIANTIRLMELEPPIRALLDSGSLLAGHGKALLSAPPGKPRLDLAAIASNQGWSVRKLELAAGNAAQSTSGAAQSVSGGGAGGGGVTLAATDSAIARAAALKDLEKQLGEHMGTHVAIRTSASGKRGSVTLKFYDLDHFDGLMTKMGFQIR